MLRASAIISTARSKASFICYFSVLLVMQRVLSDVHDSLSTSSTGSNIHMSPPFTQRPLPSPPSSSSSVRQRQLITSTPNKRCATTTLPFAEALKEIPLTRHWQIPMCCSDDKDFVDFINAGKYIIWIFQYSTYYLSYSSSRLYLSGGKKSYFRSGIIVIFRLFVELKSVSSQWIWYVGFL